MIELVIGIFGMLFILTAFVLDELEKVMQNTALYNGLNVIGATLLVYYSYSLNSLPFLILNIIWGVFAMYNLVRILKI